MTPINPSETDFVAFATKADLPVTPLIFKAINNGVMVWAAFAELERQHDYAFLLESAETGEHGRYSFMGAAPRRLFVLQDDVFSVRDSSNQILEKNTCHDPINDLAQRMTTLTIPPISPDLPPFVGGVVGCMGYDCVHYFEQVGEKKPNLLKVPDMLWMQTNLVAVFDHYRNEVYAIKSCYREDVGSDWHETYQRGRREIEALLATFTNAQRPTMRLATPAQKQLDKTTNITREQFCNTVRKFKQHIVAGDIFQGVPSQRFSFTQSTPTLDVYRCLRRLNPSPYMFYLKCDDFVLAGSSPELLVSCQKKRLQLRPIAGTRPRGNTIQEDTALEAELLADDKERAEHLMLVDLGRNDMGRVAKAGSVHVSRFCYVERYSHVMHIVSNVEGVLADGKSSFDALRATFPAGTLSGAPKVRAMQLINDAEPCKRHFYAGAAGYIGFDGDMMTCIAIRAFTAKDGKLHVQAGSGIVADSDPATEYQESCNKAAAVLRAAEMAATEYENNVTAD